MSYFLKHFCGLTSKFGFQMRWITSKRRWIKTVELSL